MKTRNFTVTALLTFPDGINKGNLKVRATSIEDAKKVALETLKQKWPSYLSIEILNVK